MQEDEQITEIRETKTQAARPGMSGVMLAQRIVWFIVGFITVVIALRFALLLFGANQGAAFTDLVYSVSGVFVAPFTGIFGQPTYGVSVFEISSILAIVIYSLLGLGIAKLLTIGRPQEEI